MLRWVDRTTGTVRPPPPARFAPQPLAEARRTGQAQTVAIDLRRPPGYRVVGLDAEAMAHQQEAIRAAFEAIVGRATRGAPAGLQLAGPIASAHAILDADALEQLERLADPRIQQVRQQQAIAFQPPF